MSVDVYSKEGVTPVSGEYTYWHTSHLSHVGMDMNLTITQVFDTPEEVGNCKTCRAQAEGSLLPELIVYREVLPFIIYVK